MFKLLKSIQARNAWKADGESPLQPVFYKEFDHDTLETWVRVNVQNPKLGAKVQDASNPDKMLLGTVETIDHEPGKQKKHCTWMEAAWAQDDEKLQANEYFHELAISLLVKQYLSDIPAFAASRIVGASYKSDGCNFQQHIGGNVKKHNKKGLNLYFKSVSSSRDLENVLNDLTYAQFHSILWQVFSSICVAQHRIRLKHHDLHLGNVLLTPADPELKSMKIDTPNGEQIIPMHGIQAVMIDFGLSSAVDPESKLLVQRLDEKLLIAGDDSDSESSGSQASDDSWGVWGAELSGDEGYDAAMFIESLVEKLFEDRPLNIPKLSLVSKLQELININFTDRGRPAEHSSIDWGKVFEVLRATLP